MKNFKNYSNVYRIYIRSAEHRRTINTPMMGRVNYTVFDVEGKENFIAKLNELIAQGEHISEVRYGWGGSYVKYWEYISR